MRQFFRCRSLKADKFTIRGIIYSTVATAGILYEIFIANQERFIVLAGYSLILIVGLVCIFFLNEKKTHS